MSTPAAAADVLVVDDEEEIRALLATILEDAGYAVRMADGGRAALAAIKSQAPDLIFLDLTMPEVDGWAVLERLREATDPPPVIVISGRGVRNHAGPLGDCVMAFLPKPFRVEDVLTTAHRVLVARAALAAGVPPDERRTAPRRSLMVDARLLGQDGSAIALGKILDLSVEGAQLDLGAPLKLGSIVNLSFEIPGANAPVIIQGRVQWLKSGTLGLVFENMTGENLARLRRILSPVS